MVINKVFAHGLPLDTSIKTHLAHQTQGDPDSLKGNNWLSKLIDILRTWTQRIRKAVKDRRADFDVVLILQMSHQLLWQDTNIAIVIGAN